MTKTIKETWKEEIYEIITHNETSECHLKLVVLVESLISQVEALVRNEVLDEVEKELTTPTKMLDTGLETNKITYEGIKHRINNLRPIKEIEEKV